MPCRTILVVPPFLKQVSGPLLGPSLLVSAARQRGHEANLIDLNWRWLQPHLPADAPPPTFVGDHGRPPGVLRRAQRIFSSELGAVLPPPPTDGPDEDPTLTLPFSHDEILAAARELAESPFGRWVEQELAGRVEPAVVGVSVLYSGQVLAALVVSLAARRLWPQAAVIWGGPHVTALREEIPGDSRYGELIDGFVFGYAERTWVDLLDAVDRNGPWPREVTRAGAGKARPAVGDPTTIPVFDVTDAYDWGHLTLPAQLSRGCAYGRCTYCTYPAIEGRYRELPLEPVLSTLRQAEARNAAISFKDSLVLPGRLGLAAELVDGRMPWSACTKLHHRLDQRFLSYLAARRLKTLEVGLETLTPGGQLLIDKRQPLALFRSFLDAAEAAGVAVVVNYMTGFPGADPGEEAEWMSRVRAEIASRPSLSAKLEHNTFQLERLSRMARDPARFGLQRIRSWPWATVLGWRVAVTAATRAG